MWKLFTAASVATVLASSSVAAADPPPPVDVHLPPNATPQRTITLEWNPLALFIQKLSANVIITPGDHHAIVLSPFYLYQSTIGYTSTVDGQGNTLTTSTGQQYNLQVDSQSFHGFGTEIGYRYYYGHGGPRGLFVGPSLLVGWMQATAGNNSKTSFETFGLAVDVGYQMLVADAWSVSVGGGLQYDLTSKDLSGDGIPPQQWPADTYVNKGFRPRFLLSLGYAF
jgi:opacity protein-like surface antigen